MNGIMSLLSTILRQLGRIPGLGFLRDIANGMGQAQRLKSGVDSAKRDVDAMKAKKEDKKGEAKKDGE